MNPLRIATFTACAYLRDRHLYANPVHLASWLRLVVKVIDPRCPEAAEQCGIVAARECARPMKQTKCELTDLE